ncbi:MAG TPA: type I glyceraldehyde-3-phosphate dehydrogenase, partial [Planctomycetes bacterium]|nr:type I glyceraldehyde-3-phosphate dehydrogenase [Planctomycetota bacterium]
MEISRYVQAKRKLKIGINGFGRIGRLVFRVMCARPDEFEVVWVNDLTDDPTLEYLLKYDTVHGRFQGKLEPGGLGEFFVDGRRVLVTSERDPSKIKWGDLGVDVVLECTGVFRTRAKAALHLEGGAKRVALSAPAKDEVDATIVLGVNDEVLQPEHVIVSNASCTTNALAPVAKVLHEEFGLKRGLMTTIHAFTNDQRLLDLPHKKYRRARAAPNNIVPTTTGAAEAVGLVLPELAGKLSGMAVRVPVPDGSLVDLVVETEKSCTAEAVNAALKARSEGAMKHVLGYTADEVVSSDIVGVPESSLVDSLTTDVQQGTLLKLLTWYDNEWGYSNRLADLAA